MKTIVACAVLFTATHLWATAEEVYLADPALYKHDGVYYLYGTEPPPQVGFRIYASKELKNWYVPETAYEGGYVLKAGEQAFGTEGFWAPQILDYQGKVTMLYTANRQIAVAFADHPTGPFVQKEIRALNEDHQEIDPFLFQDDDGTLYLYHVRKIQGNEIYVAEMESDLSRIKEGTLKHCISVQNGTWENTPDFSTEEIAEGPTLVKRKGTYYLIYSANHFMSVEYGVGYATAPSPTGPWTRHGGNPILRKEYLGINGTGHGDVFMDGDDMYYVFHTHASDEEVRPRHTMLVKMGFREAESGIDTIFVDYDSASYIHQN
ncbi:MAG: glycoside hydrolase family 43 protein [Opitutales bacterium]|jgi:xylan 1,4-beta-xylosidase|nr:glycoside hydrolase family 43 protein [Opitutales bacterium]MDG2167358.1 glycoside hydrolase family 43 protein [Opitutales bacterium]